MIRFNIHSFDKISDELKTYFFEWWKNSLVCTISVLKSQIVTEIAYLRSLK